MAAQVPNLRASISLNGAKVHTPVSAKVSSLGAAINLDGHEQKVNTPVAKQVPSLGAAISPDNQSAHTQVAPSYASLDSNTINADHTNPHAQMVSLSNISPCGQQNLANELDQNHMRHQTTPAQRPTPPEFTFDLTSKAAQKKYLTLRRKYKGILTALLEAQCNLTVGYVLEFLDVNTLEKTFG